MKIQRINLRQIAIPLNFTFAQSNNAASTTSNSIILELVNESGVSGFGESCPRLYVTGEDTNSVIRDIDQVIKSLCTTSISDYKDLVEYLDGLEIGNSTRCALELAWLDMWSKTEDQTLPDLLDITFPSSYSYSLVLPLTSLETLDKLLKRVGRFKPQSIKLKVDNKIEEHIPKLKLIRSTYGKDCSIRLDINGGWTMDEAMEMIPIYLKNNIRSFEQPLLPKDHEGMKQLFTAFGKDVIIMPDESLLAYSNAAYFIENKSCNHFNLKISKLGGISNAKKIYELAEASNISCQLGAHFGETSILSAAAILLTGMTGSMSNIEGGLGTLLLEKDLTAPPVQQDLDCKIYPSNYFNQPGLLPNIDRSIIEKYSTQSKNWQS